MQHAWLQSKVSLVRSFCSCEIELNNVFVPDHNKLAKATDFERGLNAVLMESRLTITGIFAGAMAGAFEIVYKHVMNRQQFGKPLAGF